MREVKAAAPAVKKQSTGATGRTARAFVVHGVVCQGPMTHKIREVEWAFRGKGRGVIGVRWLLSLERRRGKATSSLVVYLREGTAVGTDMAVRMRGRRYNVVEYEWGRGHRLGVSEW